MDEERLLLGVKKWSSMLLRPALRELMCATPFVGSVTAEKKENASSCYDAERGPDCRCLLHVGVRSVAF